MEQRSVRTSYQLIQRPQIFLSLFRKPILKSVIEKCNSSYLFNLKISEVRYSLLNKSCIYIRMLRSTTIDSVLFTWKNQVALPIDIIIFTWKSKSIEVYFSFPASLTTTIGQYLRFNCKKACFSMEAFSFVITEYITR